MIPDFVHDIRAREPQRATLGQAELTRPTEFNTRAPRVRGIAAESRSKKRAATFADLLQTLEAPHEQAQAEQHARQA